VLNMRQHAMTVTGGCANTLTSTDYKGAQVVYGIDCAEFNQGQNAQYTPQIDVERTSTLTAKGASASRELPRHTPYNAVRGATVAGLSRLLV
jgi:hypothetical protein